ncbi:hypothetical protein DVH24_015495 [Malus domestica]|uniref:Uncharacterized protein n=1 Tax=Malus domestica TaxID=3750 RepID=A0A498HPS9_MALDO|nr:hypothetical protein DVH24_015495 [Malus domestica]
MCVRMTFELLVDLELAKYIAKMLDLWENEDLKAFLIFPKEINQPQIWGARQIRCFPSPDGFFPSLCH